MKRLIAAIILTSTITGCTVKVDNPFGDSQMLLTGDKKSLDSYSDMTNGYITNAKASADKDTSAWRNRRVNETEVTKRLYRANLLEGIFGNAPSLALDTSVNALESNGGKE